MFDSLETSTSSTLSMLNVMDISGLTRPSVVNRSPTHQARRTNSMAQCPKVTDAKKSCACFHSFFRPDLQNERTDHPHKLFFFPPIRTPCGLSVSSCLPVFDFSPSVDVSGDQYTWAPPSVGSVQFPELSSFGAQFPTLLRQWPSVAFPSSDLRKPWLTFRRTRDR